MKQMQELAFEQYCRVMCGQSLSEHYRDCLRVTDYNMNVGGRVWPFFMYRMPWYKSSRRKVLDLMWGLVRSRKDEKSKPEKSTIMDTLMSLRDKEGNPLTDDEVVCYSMYGFAGSCSYMGRHIGFMLYELLKHPDLLRDVRREVDTAFAYGLNDAKDIRSLKLLQAVYHETLRFHPVSQGMPHIAAQDFEYLGKKVNKGDLTVISQVPMSFSKCPFANPETFDPSRCLEPRSEHMKENSFHPFGIGHRKCTAAGLVELMSLTLVATLIHEMRFDKHPANYQLKFDVKPLPAPSADFALMVTQRRAAEDRKKASYPIIEENVIASVPGREDTEVTELLKKAEPVYFAAGETIISEEDAADAFYVIAAGQVTVSKLVTGSPQVIATLQEGDFFGEVGLLQRVPRTASVTAAGTGTTVLRLDGQTFQEAVATSDLVSDQLAHLLEKRHTQSMLFDALPGLTPSSAAVILPEFTLQTYKPDEAIILEGDPAEHFYILIEGDVIVTQRFSDGEDKEINRLSRGSYFGEAGLLTGTERSATVRSGSQSETTVLACDKDGFHNLLESTGGKQGNLARAMANRLSSHQA
jgi:CRP-like cAMP-binding protein